MRPLLEIQEAILAAGGDIHESGEDGFYASARLNRDFVAQRIIVSIGGGWDHVSVSVWLAHGHAGRVPKWPEMEAVKRLCFKPEECAMQLHPAEENYVTGEDRRILADGAAVDPTPVSKYVLHLWRPQAGTIPTPPIWMV